MDRTDGSASFSGDNGRDGSGGQDGLLVELARRLLSPRYPGDPRAGTATLLPGEVPDEVLAAVPTLIDADIIGSMVLPTHVTVVMDSNLDADSVRAFYKERMLAAGWTEPGPWPHMRHGGFESNFMEEALGSTFCRSARGPELRVQAIAMPNAPTDVRLFYNTDARTSTCAQQRKAARMQMDQWWGIIPTLSAPSGSRQMPGGGNSSGDGHQQTSASLKSDLNLVAVADHYKVQLTHAGWREDASGANESMVWATYDFQDEDGEDWSSLFYVIAVPTRQGEFKLFLEAVMAGSEDRGSMIWSFNS